MAVSIFATYSFCTSCRADMWEWWEGGGPHKQRLPHSLFLCCWRAHLHVYLFLFFRRENVCGESSGDCLSGGDREGRRGTGRAILYCHWEETGSWGWAGAPLLTSSLTLCLPLGSLCLTSNRLYTTANLFHLLGGLGATEPLSLIYSGRRAGRLLHTLTHAHMPICTPQKHFSSSFLHISHAAWQVVVERGISRGKESVEKTDAPSSLHWGGLNTSLHALTPTTSSPRRELSSLLPARLGGTSSWASGGPASYHRVFGRLLEECHEAGRHGWWAWWEAWRGQAWVEAGEAGPPHACLLLGGTLHCTAAGRWKEENEEGRLWACFGLEAGEEKTILFLGCLHSSLEAVPLLPLSITFASCLMLPLPPCTFCLREAGEEDRMEVEEGGTWELLQSLQVGGQHCTCMLQGGRMPPSAAHAPHIFFSACCCHCAPLLCLVCCLLQALPLALLSYSLREGGGHVTLPARGACSPPPWEVPLACSCAHATASYGED